MTELDSKKTQLAIVISRREEYRDVAVDVYADYRRFVVEAVRQDTGETISTRPMTESERQKALPLSA